jgi:uncharacterized Zn-binding protein involved in type VI secretion
MLSAAPGGSMVKTTPIRPHWKRKKKEGLMPKAARVGDAGKHDKNDLTAVQGSPNVFINGQSAVRVGDLYQGPPHPTSQGSSTVNKNTNGQVINPCCLSENI